MCTMCTCEATRRPMVWSIKCTSTTIYFDQRYITSPGVDLSSVVMGRLSLLNEPALLRPKLNYSDFDVKLN